MRHRRSLAAIAVLALMVTGCSGQEYDSSMPHPETPEAGNQPPAPVGPSATLAPPNGKPYPDVYFDNPGVNPFIDTEDDPLSTFALDVDTGSYTVARRYIGDGNLPDKDSVRVEEYVNYFDQDYPDPRPEEGLAVVVDGGPTPFLQNERNRVIRVGVQAAEAEEGESPDANLVFVVDTSGSMAREDRLELVKRALGLLLGELAATDTVAIVEYGTTARVVLPPTQVAEDPRIVEAMLSLHPDGSTNAAAGLQLGYEMAASAFREDGINRVILCSDGVANTGDATAAGGILELIEDEVDRGIELVTVGFGMGNYNDVLMEQLADHGDGFYAYVDDLDEAHRLFVRDLTGTLQTVARDARIQVEFDAAKVQSWRLIGFENRDLADDRFRDDSVDAGEIGVGHTVTALYEVKPRLDADGGGGPLGVVHLRWIDPMSLEPREIERDVVVGDLATDFQSTRPHFQLDVLVAQYAEVLRESVWADQIGVDLYGLAEQVRGLDRLIPDDPDVIEFVDLVRRAALIADS